MIGMKFSFPGKKTRKAILNPKKDNKKLQA
jgi:hypothetical protein